MAAVVCARHSLLVICLAAHEAGDVWVPSCGWRPHTSHGMLSHRSARPCTMACASNSVHLWRVRCRACGGPLSAWLRCPCLCFRPAGTGSRRSTRRHAATTSAKRLLSCATTCRTSMRCTSALECCPQLWCVDVGRITRGSRPGLWLTSVCMLVQAKSAVANYPIVGSIIKAMQVRAVTPTLHACLAHHVLGVVCSPSLCTGANVPMVRSARALWNRSWSVLSWPRPTQPSLPSSSSRACSRCAVQSPLD